MNERNRCGRYVSATCLPVVLPERTGIAPSSARSRTPCSPRFGATPVCSEPESPVSHCTALEESRSIGRILSSVRMHFVLLLELNSVSPAESFQHSFVS